MPQVADLTFLQEYDDILARLDGELAEARAEIKDDEALRTARNAAHEADARCEGLEREQRHMEGEIDALSTKIEREEGRLYDGSVKLPKELAGIQQEIEALRARRSDIEDAELELLDSLEEAEASRAEARATGTSLPTFAIACRACGRGAFRANPNCGDRRNRLLSMARSTPGARDSNRRQRQPQGAQQ